MKVGDNAYINIAPGTNPFRERCLQEVGEPHKISVKQIEKTPGKAGDTHDLIVTTVRISGPKGDMDVRVSLLQAKGATDTKDAPEFISFGEFEIVK